MARGTEAKNLVIEKIKQAFGEDYITTSDGKIYVWAKDAGERVQIAISLTCPKNFIEAKTITPAKMDFGESDGGWDFEAMDKKIEVPAKSNEISQEEQDNIQALMKSLGLI